MKSIKPILIALVLFFLTSHLNAQIIIQHFNEVETELVNINELKEVSVIEVSINNSASGYSVKVDYGQKGHQKTLILDQSTENMKDFNSKMHMVNYFESNGWTLLDINSESRYDRDAKTYYYFKKKD